MLNLHVLIVDRDDDARRIIVASLAHDPFFIVRCCTTGAAALAAAAAWRPDLVLLDATDPEAGGPEILARLRADRRTALIPVVVLTSGVRGRERLQRLGAAGVISKPFEVNTLAENVRSFVAVESVLLPARDNFLRRLEADASALTACRSGLAQSQCKSALLRISQIAHALAGAGGTYGFAGISCESAALSHAAERNLAGQARTGDVERALNRLLSRISLSRGRI
jgi:CheY-like chemotaxis protein